MKSYIFRFTKTIPQLECEREMLQLLLNTIKIVKGTYCTSNTSTGSFYKSLSKRAIMLHWFPFLRDNNFWPSHSLHYWCFALEGGAMDDIFSFKTENSCFVDVSEGRKLLSPSKANHWTLFICLRWKGGKLSSVSKANYCNCYLY